MTEYLDLIMFAALMVAVLSGFPVSFAIAGVAWASTTMTASSPMMTPVLGSPSAV